MKEETKKAIEQSGIKVSKRLNGVSEIKKHIDAYANISNLVKKNVFFLIDNDKGIP